MKKVFFIIIIFPFVCFSQPTLDEKKALKVHNDAREEVGSPPLVWSEKLKKDAQKYADYLSTKDLFDKSKNLGGYSSRAHLFPSRTEKLSLLAQMVLPLVGEYVTASFKVL